MAAEHLSSLVGFGVSVEVDVLGQWHVLERQKDVCRESEVVVREHRSRRETNTSVRQGYRLGGAKEYVRGQRIWVVGAIIGHCC